MTDSAIPATDIHNLGSSMRKEHYHNVVIGSGEAGKFLAWTLARQNQSTIVVERSALGGACPNVACLPSKNVIHSAKVASLLRRGEEFGISTDSISVDMRGVVRRKQGMIDGLADLHIERFNTSGAEVVVGEGRFVEDRTIAVELRSGGTRLLRGERVFIATGTRAQVRIAFRIGDEPKTEMITATDLLVAAGRTPNTDRLDASKGGIELDAAGFIRVNDRLETTAREVWALGEVAGSPKFTHVSYDDFRVVRDNLAGGNRTTTNRLIPSVMFTDPELARVGLNETEAKRQGIAFRVAKIPMAAVLRSRTLSETRGFVKALVGDDDRLLGFTAFGVEASEMLAAVQTAMLAPVPYTLLTDAIFAHPTTAEGLGVLLSERPKYEPIVVRDDQVTV
ncbi:Dihydrolipoyl dehydrogenase [Stieleria maiorica]|uniref:Dihydrolipoyl dehydrogenase n=1 Tax=Stieleria maiorica TaxID=2795974 RepID=A0A5B9MKL5_9BACT|nr:FAD-dependent oxidoreductase [Stieleria maiorica]QEG01779.1 Dihydrolipoyl dehydrogenase [Stieleria maiorica]